jgi:hypothetical protein
MTAPVELPAATDRLIHVEKFQSQRGTERWCKVLSPSYPAADYWLCHESGVIQGFQRDQRHAARFVAVDLDRKLIVNEATGHPLTHWLATPAGSLDHPFQRSSDLVRLILACLRALAWLGHNGLVHGGLRPDVLVLRQNDRQEIDFDSLTVIDFSVARTAHHRIEKPLFIDLDSPDAAYIAPAMREAILRDWQTYAKLVGEPGRNSWYELSESARSQYDTVLMPELAINGVDWRVDLYALGHWFKQISLHRLDYFKDVHQEQIPALIRKMQKPVLQGGFTSLDACIKAFEALDIDPRPLVVPTPPATASVTPMHPVPVLHQPGEAPALAVHTSDFTPDIIHTPARHVPREPATGRGKLVGIGIGLIVVAATGAALLNSRERHRSESPAPHAETGHPPAPAAATPTPPKPASAVSAVTAQTDWATAPLDALRAAAEQGDPAAQTQLGLRYRRGDGLPADAAQAVAWYQRAAEQQFADAQAYLGFMYMTGRGVKRDDDAAARYARLAAEQGNTTGQFNLALLYLAGRGVAADKVEAYRWLKRAAEKDDTARAKLAELKRQLTPAQLSAAEAN